jgi:hypothetical protein
VDEEDAEVEVIVVTTQLVEEEEDAGVEVVAVSTQLVEEKNVELVWADVVVIAEMEAGTEGKKRRCASMTLRRNAEVARERMSEGRWIRMRTWEAREQISIKNGWRTWIHVAPDILSSSPQMSVPTLKGSTRYMQR